MRQRINAVVRQWITGLRHEINGVQHWAERQWAKGLWVRVAWSTALVAVAAVCVLAALMLARPSKGDLVRLVQQGDPTIGADRAGCIVDTMRESLTARRTEQILNESGPRVTTGEENVVVTAAAKCGGAVHVDIRGGQPANG